MLNFKAKMHEIRFWMEIRPADPSRKAHRLPNYRIKCPYF